MIYALKDKLIEWEGFEFEFISADIQQLNEKATREAYDVTAISMALYPSIHQSYDMLPIGASIGDKFGPVVVTKKNNTAIESIESLAGKKVAVPGKHTSAYFAASELLPRCEWVPLPFDEIESSIQSGSVDAGILIHELQLNFESFSLKKICDLGSLWNNKYQLPLPLGGIVIRKSLPIEVKKSVLEKYRESIEYAFANRDAVLAKASEWAKEGLDKELSEKYIDMYVNHDSLQLTTNVRRGIAQLFECGFNHGLCDQVEFLGSMVSD
jgi:1,4-dihydroxy-6-naphthoate synthase